MSGGIGSGKSVVCGVLRAMGAGVYDCDSRARKIMDSSAEVKRRIREEIDPGCVDGGVIDRSLLSSCVFSDPGKLETLNRIVHGAVKSDLLEWVSLHCESAGLPLFVETAILYQSGIDRLVDEVWEVNAPVPLRVERVMARSSLTEAQVRERIKAQDSFVPTALHPVTEVILNDGIHPVLPRIEALLAI